MPATSKSQQRLFGAVVAAQKGKKAGSSKIATMAKDISKKDAKDFASTPTKGLPNKVKSEAYEFSQAEKDLMTALLKGRGATFGVIKVLDKVMPVSPNKKGTDPKLAKLKKLREYIRKKIVKEMNTTGNIEGFDTPYAFGKPENEKKKGQRFAKLTGYSTINESTLKSPFFIEANEKTIYKKLHAAGIKGNTAFRPPIVGVSRDGRLWEMFRHNKNNKSGWMIHDSRRKLKPEFIKQYFKESINEERLNESVVKEIVELIAKIRKQTLLTENRWLAIKNEESPAKAKIGRGISAINRQLSEVERFLNWYGRLKQESGMSGGDFWKRTNNNIYKIKERLIKLEQHIRKFV